MWAYTVLIYLVPAVVALAAAYVAVYGTRFFLDPAIREAGPRPQEPGAS